MISLAQRNDPKRLQRLIQSIKFGIAIERGDSAVEMLTAMTDGHRQHVLAQAAGTARLAQPTAGGAPL